MVTVWLGTLALEDKLSHLHFFSKGIKVPIGDIFLFFFLPYSVGLDRLLVLEDSGIGIGFVWS